MPAYAYAIHVNYNREKVREEHEKIVSPPLTVDKLAQIVGDAKFSIRDHDEAQFSGDYVVSWTTNRDETDKEMNARIQKGEEYNRKRREFLGKHGRDDE